MPLFLCSGVLSQACSRGFLFSVLMSVLWFHAHTCRSHALLFQQESWSLRGYVGRTQGGCQAPPHPELRV